MRKTTKIWLVIAAILVVVGCMMFGGVMAVLGWDFVKLSTDKYETNKYEIEEDFNAISMNTDTADITFVPSEDAKCKVVCYEQENATHSVAVKDNTLVIETIDSRTWYEYVGINFGTPEITVYLPKKVYTSLSINEDTGDITVSDMTCLGDITLNVSTGETTLTNVECKNLISSGSTGYVFLNHVIATEKFSIKRNTGDVRFDGSDATEIFVETSTGDINGTLLSEKVFIAQTDTGKIRVPKTVTGGRCELTTDTGDIKIKYTGE